MSEYISTEEAERIAAAIYAACVPLVGSLYRTNRNDCLAAVTALRALAAERDALIGERDRAWGRGFDEGVIKERRYWEANFK